MNHAKPKRPFGISLAILTSSFIFAIIPLILIGLFTYLNDRVYHDIEGGFTGMSILGLSTTPLTIYVIAILIFLPVAFFAWRGRPSTMRFIFPIATMIMAVLMTLLVVFASTSDGSFQNGIDSAQGFREVLRQGYVAFILLIVLYVIWFFNRWSSRAYYRGYYTPEDIALMEAYHQAIALQK